MFLLVPFRALVPILGRGERRVVLDGLQPDLLGQHHGPLRVLPPHQLRRHFGRQRATRRNGKLLKENAAHLSAIAVTGRLIFVIHLSNSSRDGKLYP